MEEKILKQTLTTPAAMKASETLPQARKFLPKPVESQAPPFQYNIVQNTPSERHLYIPLHTETQQQRPVVYNSPDPIPVPKSTLYRGRGQPKQRQLRKRKKGELMFEKRHSTRVNTVNFQKQWIMRMGGILGKWGSKRFVLPLKEKISK